MTAPRETDVVVVGGGLSGVMAARRLHEAGLDVVVLEARDRLGGRLLSEPLGNGAAIDHGGQYLGPPRQSRWIMEVARQLDIPWEPVHDQGRRLLQFHGRQVGYVGLMPRLSPVVLLDIGQAQLRFDRLAQSVVLDRPWATPKAQRLDGQTFESWIRRNLRTSAGRELTRMGVQGVWGADPQELSLLHALLFVRSVARGHFYDLFRVRGGAQESIFPSGAQTVPERLAAPLQNSIVMNAPVRRIEHRDDRVRVHSNSGVVIGRHAIVAVPPVLAGRIDYDPALPPERDKLTQRLAIGWVIKHTLIYPEPFWRASGLSGQTGSDEGPVQAFFDNSVGEGRPAVLQGFTVASWARRLARLTEHDRRQAVLKQAAAFFGPRASKPDGYLEMNWAEEEWTRGCYHCYAPPGAWTSYGQAMRTPIGRLHWAGSETGIDGYGGMSGAVQAGERAAQEIVAAHAGEPVAAAIEAD